MKKLFIVLILSLHLASCENKYKVHEKAPIIVEQTVEMKGGSLEDSTKQENNKQVQIKELEEQGKLLKEAGDGLKGNQ